LPAAGTRSFGFGANNAIVMPDLLKALAAQYA